MKNKIKTEKKILKIVDNFKKLNKNIVTTNGSFDVLHKAHLRLLSEAKRSGDVLIVLLNSDMSIRRLKGRHRPIVNERDRAYHLACLQMVDYVIIFDEDNPLKLLKKIKPDIHVKGGSFEASRVEQEKKLLASWGGKFKTLKLEKGYSTTKLIEKILAVYK